MSDSEYLICAFVDEHDQAEIFAEWPLHITLVTWFSENNIDDLQHRLVDALNQTRPIDITVGQEKVWGVHTVNVIEPVVKELKDLHELLITTVRRDGKILVNEQYMDDNYTPHATQQKTQSAHPGDKVTIDTIYIIRKNNSAQMKKILYKIKLL